VKAVCIFAGAGIVVIGLPALTGIAAAAAALRGLELVEMADKHAAHQEKAEALAAEAARLVAEAETLEISNAAHQRLATIVAERATLVFRDGDLELVLSRDIRGKLTVRARSRTLGRAAVADRANAFLGTLLQQIAYREILLKMRQKGVVVTAEEREPDGTVRVRLRRNA
jgi:predicted homoserine dehydrogenase-like protein